MALSWSAPLPPGLPSPVPSPLRCVSGGLRRIGALTDGSWSGVIRRTGLGGRSLSYPIMIRRRRRTRW